MSTCTQAETETKETMLGRLQFWTAPAGAHGIVGRKGTEVVSGMQVDPVRVLQLAGDSAPVAKVWLGHQQPPEPNQEDPPENSHEKEVHAATISKQS